MNNVFFYDYSVIGRLGIAGDEDAVFRIFFGEKVLPGFVLAENPLIKRTAEQLSEYFDRRRRIFDLPLDLRGTDFQVSVWKALQTIPVGETRSYKDLAAMVGKPRACRAVGMANNRNPLAIVVPCHRVIGSDGGLTGYAAGLEIKRYLLDLEKPLP